MRFSVAINIFLLGVFSSVSAFSPAFTTRLNTVCSTTAIYSEPADDGGLDLDLEEMFDMFDAAEKEEKFDDAIKKVKGED